MSDPDHQDDQLIVPDLINDAIIARPNPIKSLDPGQLRRAARSRVFSKLQEKGVQALDDITRKIGQSLFGRWL